MRQAHAKTELSRRYAEAARERGSTEREFLREWCAWVRGDPKLSAWEEAFASDVWRPIDYVTGDHFLSRKQKAVIWRMSEKTGFRGLTSEDGFDADDDGYVGASDDGDGDELDD